MIHLKTYKIFEKQNNFDVIKYILKDCAGIDYKWYLSRKQLNIKSKENLHFIVYLDKILSNNITDKYLIQKFICQQNSIDYLLLKEIDSRIKEEYGDIADASDLGLFFKENLNMNLGFIENLYINSLDLTEISWVSQLNSLIYLYCSNNQLKELPELPSSLDGLDCENNQLKELPELPSNLTHLDCRNNQLKELPELPSSLTRLNCENNQLKELPELPSSLDGLSCDYNQLKELPKLPSSLTHLNCRNNQLKELPELPSSLTYLNCYNNPDYESWKKDKKYNKFNI